MRIINWFRTINLSRLGELRVFTMQNLVFYLAALALLLFLFELSGGWKVLFITGFESFQLVDWVKFVFSAFFFLLALIAFFTLSVISVIWAFSKKTDSQETIVRKMLEEERQQRQNIQTVLGVLDWLIGKFRKKDNNQE